jgi:UDP-N-acetylmuramate--alanine ligase
MNKYHFIGIGGIGMSALARILLQRGTKVSGSDLAQSYVTENLQKEGAEVFIGHKAGCVPASAMVVYSTAVSQNNPEYAEALQKNLPLLHRSDLLASLMKGYAPLLVTGTHGKTSTSSLLAHVLIDAGLDPCYAIGGVVRNLEANGGNGKGQYFVAEADESDGSFLKYPAFGAIITNIDQDHLDYWKSDEALQEGFKSFAGGVSSLDHLIWCADDERLASLNLKGLSYGFGEDANLRVDNYRQVGWKNVFDLSFEGAKYLEVEIPMIGGHNVLNAAAVFGLALRLNLSEEVIRRAFSHFKGVGRRAEKKGEKGQIAIYDDYAHHPTEVCATLRALKNATQSVTSSKRLVVAFQPHRYSRTKDCFEEFAAAFDQADELVLTDIFAAGEQPIAGVTAEALLKKIQGKSATSARYISRPDLVSYLVHFLRPGDVLVTMGAGDVTKIGPEILEKIPP